MISGQDQYILNISVLGILQEPADLIRSSMKSENNWITILSTISYNHASLR